MEPGRARAFIAQNHRANLMTHRADGSAQLPSIVGGIDGGGRVDHYRRVAGEHPDWAEYRKAMAGEQRVLIRMTIDRAGPDRSG